MSRLVHEGSIERRDEKGKVWYGNWVVREYEAKRLVHVIAHGKQATIDISEAQYFREGCEYVAGVLFDQIIAELNKAA